MCPIPGDGERPVIGAIGVSPCRSRGPSLSLPGSDTRILPQFESRSIAVRSWWRYDGAMMDLIRSRHHGASWSLARSRISRPGCINISCCHYSPFFPLLVSKIEYCENEVNILSKEKQIFSNFDFLPQLLRILNKSYQIDDVILDLESQSWEKLSPKSEKSKVTWIPFCQISIRYAAILGNIHRHCVWTLLFSINSSGPGPILL